MSSSHDSPGMVIAPPPSGALVAPAPPAIETRQLTAAYGERVALAGVTMRVELGEQVALLGPNGAGKSTLLGILATLRRPGGGAAFVAGHDVAKQPDAARRALGIVFQGPAHDPHLTVGENLALFARLSRVPKKERRRRVEEALREAGLEERRRDLAKKLSGGQARRVEIARAFLARPRVLLLDEPGAGLDPRARLEIAAQINELARRGTGVLFATHLGEEAERADRVLVLDRGRIVASGQPSELKREVGGEVVELHGDRPGETAAAIAHDFGVNASALDGVVRVQVAHAHEFVPRVVERYPGRFRSVVLRQPTLEDAFVHFTGREFVSEEDGA